MRQTLHYAAGVLSICAAALTAIPTVTAFVPAQQQGSSRPTGFFLAESSSSSSSDVADLGLTPELKRVTEAFAAIGDEQVRYKQLLYMAQNTKEANSFPEASKTAENKVPGCLSTVYVDGTVDFDDDAGDYVISFVGDSDGLLTKGLVALLVRCLSGNTAEAIQKVDPQFIKAAKIEQSLTPGRNNGFLNMLKSMKQKALALDAEARSGASADPAVKSTPAASESEEASPAESDASDGEQGPKYTAIVQALQVLQPTKLELVDNSHQHAGHAGNDMDGESHFDLTIVASS
ncbi:MAG: hypothetical protein SGILL_008003, partial [Bacillariaceae sp.]